MKNRTRSFSIVSRLSSATILASALAFSPAHASDHQDLDEWCSASQAQLAACILGALVVFPVVFLEELGQRFEDACVNSGGEYRDDVGVAYPHQWGCDNT